MRDRNTGRCIVVDAIVLHGWVVITPDSRIVAIHNVVARDDVADAQINPDAAGRRLAPNCVAGNQHVVAGGDARHGVAVYLVAVFVCQNRISDDRGAAPQTIRNHDPRSVGVDRISLDASFTSVRQIDPILGIVVGDTVGEAGNRRRHIDARAAVVESLQEVHFRGQRVGIDVNAVLRVVRDNQLAAVKVRAAVVYPESLARPGEREVRQGHKVTVVKLDVGGA